MLDLLLKIGLPVLMIGVVTVISDRFGPAVGGTLGAIPSKGGPVLLILALEQGPPFAAASAAAALGGAGGCGVFCLVYARVCRYRTWPVALAAAYGAFVATWAAMLPVSSFGLGAAFVATCTILVISRELLPQAAPSTARRGPGSNNMLARMATGAGMVVLITTVGPCLGTSISGLLTAIPTVTAVVALFTHAQEGPEPTIGIMRGWTHGQFGYAAFLAILAVTLEPMGVAAAFALAVAAVVVIQSIEIGAALRTRGLLAGGNEVDLPTPTE